MDWIAPKKPRRLIQDMLYWCPVTNHDTRTIAIVKNFSLNFLNIDIYLHITVEINLINMNK